MINNIQVPIYGRDILFLVEVTPEEFDRWYYDNVKGCKYKIRYKYIDV